MSSTGKYSERIADYLLGDMSQDERMSFEKDLLIDPELAFEFKRQTPIIEHLKSKALLEEIENSPDMEEAERLVQAYFQAKENDVPNSKGEDKNVYQENSVHINSASKPKKRILVPLLMTAAVLVGALLIWTVGISNQGERLYSQYYEPLDGTNFTIRGDNNEIYQEFRNALDYYINEDYSNSAILFQQIGENSPGSVEGRLYLGLSLMGAEKNAAAASVLEDYLSSFDKYVPEAKWYLALCYLQLDKRAKAKNILEELSGEAGILGENSADIVKRLNRVK